MIRSLNFLNNRKQISEAEKNEKISLAVCVILLEVAQADDHFSPEEEEDLIIAGIKKYLNLSDAEINSLMKSARDERKHAVDLWHYTHVVQKNFSHAERLKLIENVWRLILSDSRLDAFENALAHKISTLFHIPHSEFIQAKLKVMDGEGGDSRHKNR